MDLEEPEERQDPEGVPDLPTTGEDPVEKGVLPDPSDPEAPTVLDTFSILSSTTATKVGMSTERIHFLVEPHGVFVSLSPSVPLKSNVTLYTGGPVSSTLNLP